MDGRDKPDHDADREPIGSLRPIRRCGTPVGPVRLPGLPALSEAERAELRAIVSGWGTMRAAAE